MYILKSSNFFYKYLSKEDKLQNAVINYAEAKHKAMAIPCNTESKKSKFEQYKFLVMGGRRFTLDIFFPYPKGVYNGLFLELKADGQKIYKKNGQFFAGKKGEHIRGQYERMLEHRLQGFKAEFAIGIDQAIIILDEYFKI
jgi:hypothetical protein